MYVLVDISVYGLRVNVLLCVSESVWRGGYECV